MGDIIDGWRFKTGFYWPRAHTNVMRRFLTLSKRGTQVTYVTGNHDEFLRKYSDMEVGNIRVVDEAVHRARNDKRFLVVHGDAYDVVTRYHRSVALLGGLGYDMLIALNAHLNRWRAEFGYGYWSLSAWVKYRVKRAVSFVSGFEKAVSHHCRQRGFDGVVCGHMGRGVDTTLFVPRRPTCRDRPKLLYVGRIAIEKNLEAFLNLTCDSTKVVVGDGPARKELQSRHPDVEWVGYRYGAELAGCYADADVFCVPVANRHVRRGDARSDVVWNAGGGVSGHRTGGRHRRRRQRRARCRPRPRRSNAR